MAGGMLTKQAILLTAIDLNLVNDTVQGGAIFALPSGVQPPAWSQTLPGDRIVLDDVSAFGLSSTAIGTLYGGVYEYVQTLATATAAPARGTLAFWLPSSMPPNTTLAYQVTSDVSQTLLPAYIAGVFINAVTKGDYRSVQVAGIASVLFDNSLDLDHAFHDVSAKVSQRPPPPQTPAWRSAPSPWLTSLASAIGTPVISTISSVIILPRRTFCGASKEPGSWLIDHLQDTTTRSARSTRSTSTSTDLRSYVNYGYLRDLRPAVQRVRFRLRRL